MLHLMTANGMSGLNNIALQTVAEQQYAPGRENIDSEEFYLLEDDIESLMGEPVEIIRGWLCEILIAREDFDFKE